MKNVINKLIIAVVFLHFTSSAIYANTANKSSRIEESMNDEHHNLATPTNHRNVDKPFEHVYVGVDPELHEQNGLIEELSQHADAKKLVITGLQWQTAPSWTGTDYYRNFEPILTLPQLEELWIYYYIGNKFGYNSPRDELTKEQWEIISLSPVKKLFLYFSKYKNVNFSDLQKNTNLEKLMILNSHLLTSENLNDINNLSHTHVLLLNSLENIEDLNLLNEIEMLTLQWNLTPDQLEQLEYVTLPKLNALSLARSKGIKGLRVDILAPNLIYLNLNDTDISGLTVNNLAAIPSLESVSLKNTKITSGAVKNLSKLTGLKKIDLSGTDIKSADFNSFVNLKQIESLDLSETSISRADLLTLYNLKHLKELRVVGLTSVTVRPEDLQALKDNLPSTNVIIK